MEKIEVTIQGKHITIKTSGFVGASCTKATEELERALGIKVSDKKTPEYFATSTATIKAAR